MTEFLNDLQDWTPALWAGLKITVLVTVVTMVLSLVLGFVIALLRLRGPAWLRALMVIYVEVFRGLPIIVLLFLLYFGLPAAGLTVTRDPVIAGILGFSLMLGAYLSEVIRASILAVDAGQLEAALSLGMTRRRAYVRVIIPQAMLIAVPTLGGYFIQLFKDSSLLGFIGVSELLRSGTLIVSATFKAFEVYAIIGVIYLVLSVVASYGIRRLERRLRPFENAVLGRQARRGPRNSDPAVPPEIATGAR